ncbi:pyridoxal-phosphate dependent enzyme [Runella sp.]|uniref:1-aminocyclopropane-1-carboxylate deaminase/D-cysteine desulfhydrase n=1 Tax=Runella sp. TaxID=1960881 RepID=UPI00260BF6EC|nr:pyridoxal-phosphate dependent enzyme [Runella sp.]
MGRVTAFWENTAQTPLQIVEDPFFIERGITLYFKRDDLIHPYVSGNKWRKLKYNLFEAEKKGFTTLLTFGGAYSNHIAATAAAGQATGFDTIGIIRGDELRADANPTLRFASQCGMKLLFVSREEYRDKEKLAQLVGEGCYIIPEGGSNALAVQGVAEVVAEIQSQLNRPVDYLCTALGTGGTAAGLLSASEAKVLVFPSLKIKGEEAKQMILQHLSVLEIKAEIMTDYHFGGYGKVKDELWKFIEQFETQINIPLEQVYTGKMMFGIYDLVKKGFFKQGDILVALHTGGLQGKTK